MKKLIISVVQNEDADNVVDALLENEFRATRLASTGGFLRRVLDLIRANARSGAAPSDDANAPVPAAATVFVIDLEEYQRL
jgi:uncharacterized protein YaaQ